MDPVFLGLDEILRIHVDQIDRYGGLLGVRDMDLLLSAIAMPAAVARGRFFHEDIPEMAAAHLYHIVRNHPFLDGNKRVGAMASYVFLRMNGLEPEASESAFENVVLRVAEGKMEKTAAAEFLRKHTGGRKDGIP